MSAAILLLPLYAFTARTGTILQLYLYLSAHLVADRHWVTSKYQTGCIMLHVLGGITERIRVTFDKSVCATYFPNSVRHLNTTLH